jgi:hypothetical protein
VTTDSTRSPVTRETSAYVRDKGLRAVIATITGGCIILRAKGLRSREVVDIGSLYHSAVKQRVAQERAERRATRGKGKQRGGALLEALLCTIAFAFILGAFGPTLDTGARYDTYVAAAALQPGEAELIDAEARHACGEAPAANAGWMQDTHGAHICTDKHGRRHRSQITTAIKVQR